jgi:GH24 family phage-related lysozyme (muramidase)
MDVTVPAIITAVEPYTRQFEGEVPYFYLDTVGRVTGGVGSMFPNAQAAIHIPWLTSANQPATVAQIVNDFNRVAAMPKGMVAKHYFSPNGLHITQATMDSLLINFMIVEDANLTHYYKDAYTLAPDPAREAVLDMGYNLGVGGLLKWNHLHNAINAGDYNACAADCLRQGVPARNAWTVKQFQLAAAIKAGKS